jgi:2',3'-cyclic-nucleotide 2'-phosphodiesterase (5'-nucleotidase family)
MKEEGADIIIALAHSGLDATKNEQDEVYPLSKIEGIDVILFGHRHVVFPDQSRFKNIEGVDNKTGTINGVAGVEAGSWGITSESLTSLLSSRKVDGESLSQNQRQSPL